MQYKPLGKTGVRVSALCMGTMMFGKEEDRTASAALYKRCRDAGINRIRNSLWVTSSEGPCGAQAHFELFFKLLIIRF